MKFEDNVGTLDNPQGGAAIDALDDVMQSTKPDTGSDVPDGNYIAYVKKIERSETKDKVPCIKWQLVIISPEAVTMPDGDVTTKKRMLFRNDMLAATPTEDRIKEVGEEKAKTEAKELTRKRVGWFKGAIKLAGCRDIEAGETSSQYIDGYVLPSMKDEVLKIKKKTTKGAKGDFENNFIQGTLGNIASGTYQLPDNWDEEEFPG